MANPTSFFRLAVVGIFLTVWLSLNQSIEAQQATATNESHRQESSFSAPPSFEKRPQRVPSRVANSSSYSPESDQEWLPKTSQSAEARSLTSNVDSSVQQASFTKEVATKVEPASQVNSNATDADPRPAQSPIPLKPPSKDPTDLVPSKSRNGWTSGISMVVSLLLVIGIFLGLSWVFRKTTPSAGALLPKEVVEIVGRTPMANRQQLYVIRFGRKLVLVSQQVGQTEVLSEINDRTEVDHLLGLCEQTHSRSVSSSFRSVLQQVATSADSKWSLRQRRDSPRPLRSDPSSIDTLS